LPSAFDGSPTPYMQFSDHAFIQAPDTGTLPAITVPEIVPITVVLTTKSTPFAPLEEKSNTVA